jgi:FkbM family methyltransferase
MSIYEREAPVNISKIIGKYKVPVLPLSQNPIVVDCGVGPGYFFWFYHSFFKNYFGVEASSQNLLNLHSKFKLANSTNCSAIHRACYSTSDESVDLKKIKGTNVMSKGFTVNNNSIFYEVGQKQENWDNPISEKDLEIESVTTICLDSIFSKLKCKKIDFLKVDIEGAEYDFLMGKDLSRVRFLAVECPPNKKKSKLLSNYILSQGFKLLFSNKRDFTFCRTEEKTDDMYFVDFPTVYFSKMKNDFPFSEVLDNFYLKDDKPNIPSIYLRFKNVIKKLIS